MDESNIPISLEHHQWYIKSRKQAQHWQGPFSTQQLIRYIQRNHLKDHNCLSLDTEHWQEVGELFPKRLSAQTIGKTLDTHFLGESDSLADSRWYAKLRVDSENIQGPVGTRLLIRHIQRGRLKDHHYISRDQQHWLKVGSLFPDRLSREYIKKVLGEHFDNRDQLELARSGIDERTQSMSLRQLQYTTLSVREMLGKIPGKFYLLLAVIIMASSNSIVKKLIELGKDNLHGDNNPITFCNVLFAGNLCALFALLVVYRKEVRLSSFASLSQKDWLSVFVVATLSVAIAPSVLVIALENTSVTNVVLIGRIEPPLLLMLSFFLLGERSNFWQTGGAIVAFSGVLVTVALQHQQQFSLGRGEIMAAVGAVSFASSTIITKRWLTEIPLGVLMVLRLFIGTLLFFAIAMYMFGPSHFADLVSPFLWRWMLFYGAVIIVLGQLCWFHGLRKAAASDASLATSLTPVAGILAAFIILYEIPSSAQFIGGGVILTGIFLAQYGATLQPKQTSPSETHPQELLDSGIGFKGL